MSIVSMKALLESGVHFGHQTRRWNPKMAQFIFTSRNGIHIIDLQKTMQRLKVAYNAMKEIVEENGKVLFVGTKKQAQASVVEYATNCGMFYVAERWLGGLLTNFDTVSKSIQRLKELENMKETDQWDAETKKEILELNRELEKKEKVLSGIKDMSKLPEALFVIDPKREAIAVKEARKLRIPIFAVVDTNCNPDEIDYPIPGNDDAIRAIALFLEVMSRAINEGKSAGQVEEEFDEEGADEAIPEEVEGTVDEIASGEDVAVDAGDDKDVKLEKVESDVDEDAAVATEGDSIDASVDKEGDHKEEEGKEEAAEAPAEKAVPEKELNDKYQEEYGDLDEKDSW